MRPFHGTTAAILGLVAFDTVNHDNRGGYVEVRYYREDSKGDEEQVGTVHYSFEFQRCDGVRLRQDEHRSKEEMRSAIKNYYNVHVQREDLSATIWDVVFTRPELYNLA